MKIPKKEGAEILLDSSRGLVAWCQYHKWVMIHRLGRRRLDTWFGRGRNASTGSANKGIDGIWDGQWISENEVEVQ